ncbi:MAG: PHP domain-containing protein [Candidatus Dormibacteria bacterium]
MESSVLPSNRVIAELLARASGREKDDQHRRALRRASRAALMWPVEAVAIAADGVSLTTLPRVGPWINEEIHRLVSSDSFEEPPLRRAGFMSWSEASSHAAHFSGTVRCDLQAHTLWSDGHSSAEEMIDAARARGYEHLLITDHSQGLPIANGMSPERLRHQWRELELLQERTPVRVLRGIEMNLDTSGAGDMPEESLAGLDVILGAFHSALRLKEDQTERYLAAVHNPWVDVLAHPRGRMYDHRVGLTADWGRVFDEAARMDKAIEVDGYMDRQDVDVELLKLAADAGVRVSFGSDAHHVVDLPYITFSVGSSVAAGVSPERVLNCMSADELVGWAAEHRRRALQ